MRHKDWVWGQPGIHSKTMFHKVKNKVNKKEEGGGKGERRGGGGGRTWREEEKGREDKEEEEEGLGKTLESSYRVHGIFKILNSVILRNVLFYWFALTSKDLCCDTEEFL